jgi:two-component system, sensor histidine kinase and response regulator
MKKILVIEDQKILREELLDLLTLEKFRAIGAENGEVGLELAQNEQPDLILCDVSMPALDGHGVLLALRQSPTTATIPFIFLTARADKSALRQGMQLGADDYLTKPFTSKELFAAIAAQFRKQDAIFRKTQQTIDKLRDSITLALPHELHTPLSGIMGAADLLIEYYEDLSESEVRDMLQSIRKSADRLYGLTQNFLLQAELELIATNAERVLALRRNQANSVTEAIVDTARSIAQKANREADLHFHLQDAQDVEKGVTVAIAEKHLQKIAQEVIDNAFKFSEAGTTVDITTKLTSDQFCLIVGDRGRGLTPEQIADVGAYMQFERHLHEQQGSGLGLSVARRLTELYGGTLTIDSIPNQHTTIQVRLPLPQ